MFPPDVRNLPARPAPIIWDVTKNAAENEAYERYLVAAQNYRFEHYWLQIALTAQEYAAVKAMPIGLLADLYDDIYYEGPNGSIWYNQLRRMGQILDGDDPAHDPNAFFNHYLDTYEDILMPLLRKREDLTTKVFTALESVEDSAAMMPDVEGYTTGGPPGDVIHTHVYANKKLAARGAVKHKFVMAMDEHAKVVLAGYVLNDIPELAPAMAAHQNFVAMYRLDDPTTPIDHVAEGVAHAG